MPWVRLAVSCDAPLVFREREERTRERRERERERQRERGSECVREISLVTRNTGHAVEAFEREMGGRERAYRESTPTLQHSCAEPATLRHFRQFSGGLHLTSRISIYFICMYDSVTSLYYERTAGL